MKDALPAHRGEPFFFRMGLLLLLLVVAGFAPQIWLRPGGVAAMPALLHVHGALLLAWFLLFINQARLIPGRRIRLHSTFGQLSVMLAALLVVVAFFVVVGAYARPDFSIAGGTPAASVMFPFTDIVNFLIVYTLGLAQQRNAAAHKRLMLLAGILIMDPAVARLVFTLGAPPPLILVIELGLLAALFIYDVRTRGRPHWASVLGLILYGTALAAKFSLAKTAGWAHFVEAVFG